VPRFRHVILIVFENHEVGDLLGNSAAPTFNRRASRYATIPALVFGPLVRPHAQSVAPTNQSGLLRTVEAGLRLSLLGRSAGVRPIVGIWR
jgi:hypothetical protein